MADTNPPEIDPRDLKIADLSKLLADLTQENQRLGEANKQLGEQNKRLEERIERLEALLAAKVDAKSSKTPVFTENYSLGRNKLGTQDSDKKSLKKPPKKSTGRKPSDAKEHLISDTIKIFPPDVDRDQCVHHRFQSAWRIVGGQAVYL